MLSTEDPREQRRPSARLSDRSDMFGPGVVYPRRTSTSAPTCSPRRGVAAGLTLAPSANTMPLSLVRPATATATATTPLPPIQETDLDRVLKLIPTEMLAFYTAAVPVIPEVHWRYFPFALFVVCMAI